MNVVLRWAVRIASLAGCAAAFWLVAWLTFGAVVAHWVALFAATALFPLVLGIGHR